MQLAAANGSKHAKRDAARGCQVQAVEVPVTCAPMYSPRKGHPMHLHADESVQAHIEKCSKGLTRASCRGPSNLCPYALTKGRTPCASACRLLVRMDPSTHRKVQESTQSKMQHTVAACKLPRSKQPLPLCTHGGAPCASACSSLLRMDPKEIAAGTCHVQAIKVRVTSAARHSPREGHSVPLRADLCSEWIQAPVKAQVTPCASAGRCCTWIQVTIGRCSTVLPLASHEGPIAPLPAPCIAL